MKCTQIHPVLGLDCQITDEGHGLRDPHRHQREDGTAMIWYVEDEDDRDRRMRAQAATDALKRPRR